MPVCHREQDQEEADVPPFSGLEVLVVPFDRGGCALLTPANMYHPFRTDGIFAGGHRIPSEDVPVKREHADVLPY